MHHLKSVDRIAGLGKNHSDGVLVFEELACFPTPLGVPPRRDTDLSLRPLPQAAHRVQSSGPDPARDVHSGADMSPPSSSSPNSRAPTHLPVLTGNSFEKVETRQINLSN